MASELQIRCLGRFSLGCWDALETAVEIPLPATLKAQSLLAYLVVNRGRPQTRDHLGELFWGNRPEHNARRSLATALWQIRRCLPGDAFILADTTEVQFNSLCPFWLDVAEFEHLLQARPPGVSALEQAVTLYHGDFLDGFYDDWVLGERYRLESLYCAALAQLVAVREAGGEHEAALAAALRLLEQDALREDAHRAAMRAYCRLGQRHAALAQYERCRQALEAELGVAPMAETLALRRAIAEGRLKGEPGLAITPRRVEAPPRGPARHPLDAAGQVPLVAREKELAFLSDAWWAAQRGSCSLLLVSGEAGIGKTRLVQEFANQQRWLGVHILHGRCYEFEHVLPYQPVAEALRALPQALAAAAWAAVPGWVGAQVARLAPELLTGAVEEPGEGQERLFEGIARFLAQLAGQEPLLLVLEDLHWATDSTLELLHYLARSAIDRLLIVGTLRLEAVPAAHPLATLGRRLERDGLARRLELSCLSANAVAALIKRMSGAGEAARPLAARLYRETEGNPFYLIQTLKALFEEGAIHIDGGTWQADYAALGRGRLPLPASVAETITARVGRLSEKAQDAVRVAAVAGREFDYDLLNAAWGQGEEVTLAALDDLLRFRLIAEAGTGADYAFTHHKIQEVVYEGLPRHRRLYLHGQVGLALEGLLGSEAGLRVVELAYHFEQARQLDGRLTDKAIGYLRQAGRQAEQQSANQEALGYYRRGLDILHTLPETSARLQKEIELQMALTVPITVVHGYASPEAKDVYHRARQLSRKVGDAPALFTALVGLCRYYGVTGDGQTVLKLAEELLVAAEAAQDSAWLLEACRQMGGAMLTLGRLREAQAYWQRGLAIYDLGEHEHSAYRFGHDPAVTFHSSLILALWLQGYPDQALGQSRRLRDLIQHLSHPTSLAYAYCFLALGACLRGDAAGTERDAHAAIRLGRSHGLPTWTALATVLEGWALAEQGQMAEGLARLQEGTAAWCARGFVHDAPVCLALHAESCLKAHAWGEASAAVAAARSITQSGKDVCWAAEMDRLQGELLWAQGAAEAAVEAHFCAALETARRQEARMLELRAAISLARLWKKQGRQRAARQLLAEIYGWFAEGFDMPELQAADELLRSLGE